MRLLPAFPLALACVLLTGCPGGSEQPKPPVQDKPKPPLRYERPRLPDWALSATLYYPVDTCLVTGRKLTPTCHNEVVEGHLVRTYNQHACATLKADPSRYLATLREAYLEQQRKTYPLTVCAVTGKPLGDSPHDVLIDPRTPLYTLLEQESERGRHRYTVAWRLIRLADASVEEELNKIDMQGSRKRVRVAGEAMNRIVEAIEKRDREAYLEQSHLCVVNQRATGREFEDPETGGYRNYLLHDRLFIVCCKTCLDKIDHAFFHQADAIAFRGGVPIDDVSPFATGKRVDDPPADPANPPGAPAK